MESSFQLSNLALNALVKETKILENCFVNNIQGTSNGWLKLKVHSKQGDKTLVITPNAFFISNKSIQAKQSPGGFSAFLKKYINKQKIIKIDQHGLDRIIKIEFPSFLLILELFAKGNIILCDKNMKIIRAMRREEWKDRKLEQDEEYKFPSSRGISPVEEKLDSFVEKIKKSQKTLFGAVLDTLNVSPQIAEYVFDKNKIDKKKNAEAAEKKEIEKILFELKKIYSEESKNYFLFEGTIYTTQIGKPAEEEFDSVNSALNNLLITKDELPQEEPDKKTSKKEKGIESKKRILQGLTGQETELKKKGEFIYENYSEIKDLLGAALKAKEKKYTEEETINKINSIKPCIKSINFKKNKLIYVKN